MGFEFDDHKQLRLQLDPKNWKVEITTEEAHQLLGPVYENDVSKEVNDKTIMQHFKNMEPRKRK